MVSLQEGRCAHDRRACTHDRSAARAAAHTTAPAHAHDMALGARHKGLVAIEEFLLRQEMMDFMLRHGPLCCDMSLRLQWAVVS